MDVVIIAQYLRNIEELKGNNSRFIYLANLLSKKENTMEISQKYNLPIISSFGDDYYGIKANKLSVIKRMQLFLLRKKLKQFISKWSRLYFPCSST